MGNMGIERVGPAERSREIVRCGGPLAVLGAYVPVGAFAACGSPADPKARVWRCWDRRINHMRRYLHRGTDELRRGQLAANEGERSPPRVLDAMI
jgi:hypothetical protein